MPRLTCGDNRHAKKYNKIYTIHGTCRNNGRPYVITTSTGYSAAVAVDVSSVCLFMPFCVAHVKNDRSKCDHIVVPWYGYDLRSKR